MNVPMTVLLGACLYYPRPRYVPIGLGIGVDVSCNATPEVNLYANVIDTNSYTIYLSFSNGEPPEVKNITSRSLSIEDLKNSKVPLQKRNITTNALEQQIIQINIDAFGIKSSIEMSIDNVISDTF